MDISKLSTVLSTFSLLSVLAMSLPAEANPRDNAAQLLPLESRSVIVQVDPDLYKSVAYEINTDEPTQSDSRGIADALGAGFLEDLVDDNGDVNLPLGITVFDAMGTTSVGFGGDF